MNSKGYIKTCDLLYDVYAPIKPKRIFKNAVSYRVEHDSYTHIRFHHTDIALYNDDFVILNTGGYRTNTTKERINQVLKLLGIDNVCIRQRDFEWLLARYPKQYPSRMIYEHEFFDGIKINLKTGMVIK